MKAQFYDAEVTDAFNYLKLNGSESILHIGCSDGDLLKSLLYSKHTGELIGIDSDTEIKEVHDKNLTILQAVADNLPFADQKFDVVISIGVIHGFDNLPKAFSELQRVLKKDGKIIFILATQNSFPVVRAVESITTKYTGIRLFRITFKRRTKEQIQEYIKPYFRIDREKFNNYFMMRNLKDLRCVINVMKDVSKKVEFSKVTYNIIVSEVMAILKISSEKQKIRDDFSRGYLLCSKVG